MKSSLDQNGRGVVLSQKIGKLSDIRWICYYGRWSQFSISRRYLKNIFHFRRFWRRMKFRRIIPKNFCEIGDIKERKISCDRSKIHRKYLKTNIAFNNWNYQIRRIISRKFLWVWRYHRKEDKIWYKTNWNYQVFNQKLTLYLLGCLVEEIWSID